MEKSKTDVEVRGWPVAEVAESWPLVVDLLAVHVPDERGRCIGCAVDPDRRPPWPCGPQRLADEARLSGRRFRPPQ
jgi:hypothetical protein